MLFRYCVTSKRCYRTLISCSDSQGRIRVDAGRLTISRIGLSDSGMYQCVAHNDYGSVYASAELKVVGEQIVYSLSCMMD